MYANGYNICHVDLDSHEGRAYLREFDGDCHWHADMRRSGGTSDGKVTFAISTKREPAGAGSPGATHAAGATPKLRDGGDAEPGPLSVLITSKDPNSVRKLSADILRKPSGGVACCVFVSPFGKGIRNLVNNRYLFSHAGTPVSPYANVFSLLRGPRKFEKDEIHIPVWKLWLCNGSSNGNWYHIGDTDSFPSGWHSFVVRWDHTKPSLELVIDGQVLISVNNYLPHWPEQFTSEITVGAWPRPWSEHYIETCAARWKVLENAFDTSAIEEEKSAAQSLPRCPT
jgi:hypothetical protein